jgi:hypothetical protein
MDFTKYYIEVDQHIEADYMDANCYLVCTLCMKHDNLGWKRTWWVDIETADLATIIGYVEEHEKEVHTAQLTDTQFVYVDMSGMSTSSVAKDWHHASTQEELEPLRQWNETTKGRIIKTTVNLGKEMQLGNIHIDNSHMLFDSHKFGKG